MIHDWPSPMQQALRLAQHAASYGEVPVGAVIMHNDVIIAAAHNLTEMNSDPTAHAEMLAIAQAAQKLQSARLAECDLYVTLEPCAMCAAAISHARIRRLYFGAWDVKGGAVENGGRFFSQPTCHHAPEVIGGIDESASAGLLKAFFATRRQ